MDTNQYDKLCEQTDVEPNLTCHMYGLLEEAGEAAGKMKRYLRGDYIEGDEETILTGVLALELGDILWYTSRVAADLGFTLHDIMVMNVEKLQKRAALGTIKGTGDVR